MPTKSDAVAIMNLVRSMASAEFQARVPVATLANIADVGNPITGEDYPSIQNEFIQILVCRIAKTIVDAKQLKNPLSVLKQGVYTLGLDIQEIGVNPAEATEFDPTGADLMARALPDVKVAYHRRNRKDKYKVTVSDELLYSTFVSWDNFNAVLAACVQSLYNGDYVDEFLLMKQTLGLQVINKKIKEQVVGVSTGSTFGRDMVLAMQNASDYMAFPSDGYTSYLENLDPPDPSQKGYVTQTDVEDQIIIIRADVKNQIGVDVLAQAFNMSQADYRSRVLPTDGFGDASNVLAIVCDKSWPQIWDNLSKLRQFDNGSGLYRTYFWHHWQTYSVSPLKGAIALVDTATP